MIWRRNVLTPATFLKVKLLLCSSCELGGDSLKIIVIKVFTDRTRTCRPAEYPTDNHCCPMCAAGSRVKTDCSEFRSTSCLPCLDGTFMNRPTGLKECLPCISCDEGLGLKVKTSCTTTSDAVCEPLDGFYCIDPMRNNCVAAQKHRICHPGQYINQTGTASTDTVCSDCSNGTFSDGTFTSCQPHTQCESINLQLIKQGNASTDAECGEKSSNVAVDVNIICALLLLLLISAGLVSFFYFRLKKTDSQQAGRNTSSSVVIVENEEESSEPIKIPPD